LFNDRKKNADKKASSIYLITMMGLLINSDLLPYLKMILKKIVNDYLMMGYTIVMKFQKWMKSYVIRKLKKEKDQRIRKKMINMSYMFTTKNGDQAE